ncbi:ISNCY family transposase, partial [Arthrospira sp. PCC 8006]
HGQQHLSSLLATLNILSLLFHTLLELLDDKYQLLRAHLPTRQTFFDDLRALTRYLYFDSWEHLLTFMLEGLELDIPPDSS